MIKCWLSIKDLLGSNPELVTSFACFAVLDYICVTGITAHTFTEMLFCSISEGRSTVSLLLLHVIIQACAQVKLCLGCFSAGTVGALSPAMKASCCKGTDYCQF